MSKFFSYKDGRDGLLVINTETTRFIISVFIIFSLFFVLNVCSDNGKLNKDQAQLEQKINAKLDRLSAELQQLNKQLKNDSGDKSDELSEKMQSRQMQLEEIQKKLKDDLNLLEYATNATWSEVKSRIADNLENAEEVLVNKNLELSITLKDSSDS